MDAPKREAQLPMWLGCFLARVQFSACQQKDAKTEATNAATRAAAGSALEKTAERASCLIVVATERDNCSQEGDPQTT